MSESIVISIPFGVRGSNADGGGNEKFTQPLIAAAPMNTTHEHALGAAFYLSMPPSSLTSPVRLSAGRGFS